jgi:hypothetical protein
LLLPFLMVHICDYQTRMSPRTDILYQCTTCGTQFSISYLPPFLCSSLVAQSSGPALSATDSRNILGGTCPDLDAHLELVTYFSWTLILLQKRFYSAFSLVKKQSRLSAVAHACNPSYPGGCTWEEQSSRPAQANFFVRFPLHKEKSWEW